MKALILAAGFGTRLLPYTENTPKPLFTFFGRPLLDTIIFNLQDAGCKSIIINTHHLHKQLDAYLAQQNYSIPVVTRHEPVLLGTAGAIKNVTDFWDDKPFMVINSDIVTNISLKRVYGFHLAHDHPATLLLYDDEEFNTVIVDKNCYVTGFLQQAPISNVPCSFSKHLTPKDTRTLTYTGIQVLDPEVLEFIPESVFSSCIELYRTLLSKNKKLYAFISKEYYWKDIGTPERYSQANLQKMVPEAFRIAFPDWVNVKIHREKLKGDGSDRSWYRLTTADKSLVMVDHGIRIQETTNETDSFVAIGRHLYGKGVKVPRIYLYDTFSGLVFLEDLGDVNLQSVVQNTRNPDKILSYYQSVIRLLINLSLSGAKDFDPAWTYQTDSYNQDLILEKECRYFVDAFLRKYHDLDICFEEFEEEFIFIANKAIKFSVTGFMHRDFQSRNIMVKNNQFYLIDFQGGRLGPIQYDLASLLIDPYVELPYSMQAELLEHGIQVLSSAIEIEPKNFVMSYKYCALTRNLQILGAFAYLSRVRGKVHFEKYIPGAVTTLKHTLSSFDNNKFPKLKSTVEQIG